jgi:adenylate kinase
MKNIVIFGAPGSGKGTQSDLMVEKYGLGHISTGDVLRKEMSKGTEFGLMAKRLTDNGQLVPDDMMIKILSEVYDSHTDDDKGVIFDGYPRTITQAAALKDMLAERHHSVSAMIELVVPEKELIDRIVNRGKESGRSDDNAETARKRLEVYHQRTAPVIDWYEKEGLHYRINGQGDIDHIFGDICDVIDKLRD